MANRYGPPSFLLRRKFFVCSALRYSMDRFVTAPRQAQEPAATAAGAAGAAAAVPAVVAPVDPPVVAAAEQADVEPEGEAAAAVVGTAASRAARVEAENQRAQVGLFSPPAGVPSTRQLSLSGAPACPVDATTGVLAKEAALRARLRLPRPPPRRSEPCGSLTRRAVGRAAPRRAARPAGCTLNGAAAGRPPPPAASQDGCSRTGSTGGRCRPGGGSQTPPWCPT